jgi:hypothetical protein
MVSVIGVIFRLLNSGLKFSNGLVSRVGSVHQRYDTAPVDTCTGCWAIFDSSDGKRE